MEYKYQAKNTSDQIVEGIIDAPSQDIAISILHNKQLVVLSLEPLKKDVFSKDLNQLFSRTTNKDIVVFTRQLSTLIEADMPLAEGLRTLAQQTEKPGLKKIVMDVAQSVEGGSSLSSALSAHPQAFTTFFIKLVEAGEVSGKLQGSLLYLADYLERSQGINAKIRGALIYPAFIVSALLVVALIMGLYVLPQLLAVFKDSGVTDLPLTTRMLMASTQFLNDYFYYIMTFLLGAGFFTSRFLKTPQGIAWRDDFLVNMPALGGVVRNLFLARISESLSTLIKSGLPILDTLTITADLVGNGNYREILLTAEDNVRSGGSISEVFSKYKEVPPLFSSMISIGERTGKLDYMLEHLSKFYKSESENAINSITQLIEPILVLVLGLAVAILVSSILLPIYSLVGSG